MDNNREYSILQPFDIDDNQLEAMNHQEIFVLGYELGDISSRLKSGMKIESQLIHTDNISRIQKASKIYNRSISIIQRHDDWAELSVVQSGTTN